MPTVRIYYKQELVKIETFRRNFYVLEDVASGEFYWSSDDQKAKAGILKTWIQLGDTHPQIRGVLPEWQLFINGTKQASRFYDEVGDLDGKQVEMQYQNYRFVFHFGDSP